MRADRAYIAGLGTTGVLVASALLLLVVVSTLVAFRGWPGTDAAEDIGNLIVGDTERQVAVQDGPARAAREAAPAAGAVAETAAPGTAAATPDPAPPAPPQPARRPPQTTVAPGARTDIPDDSRLRPGVDIGGVVTDTSPSAGDLLPGTPVSADVERVTTGLGDATQGVTDGLGRAVSGLSPPLGGTLIDTGRLLADILRALGQQRR
jgi:hypothetical protein